MKTRSIAILSILGAASLGLMVSQGAWAQSKEGCDVTGEAAMGAEAKAEGSVAPKPKVGEEVSEAERAAMEGSTEGSKSPTPGRGKCDTIEELPKPKT